MNREDRRSAKSREQRRVDGADTGRKAGPRRTRWQPHHFPSVLLLVVLLSLVFVPVLRGLAGGSNGKGQAVLAILPLGLALVVSDRAERARWSRSQVAVVRALLVVGVLVIWLAIFTQPPQPDPG